MDLHGRLVPHALVRMAITLSASLLFVPCLIGQLTVGAGWNGRRASSRFFQFDPEPTANALEHGTTRVENIVGGFQRTAGFAREASDDRVLAGLADMIVIAEPGCAMAPTSVASRLN